MDLTFWSNRLVRLRFVFDTLDEWRNDFTGWFIDDVEIVSFTCTPTMTPTISPTPTITTTPTITKTATMTVTPTITLTPTFMPIPATGGGGVLLVILGLTVLLLRIAGTAANHR
ncbi:hypothetical protein JW905_04770 [bacterium]|nr:hypothetical protein [candidate division CSSED10-310 bacterium]